MEKIKILALFGKSGAGKDTILSYLVNNFDFNRIVLTTTRPPRSNEIEGVDYHFIKKQDLEEIHPLDVLDIQGYNNWYYVLKDSSLSKEKVNIGVFNISTIKNLLKFNSINILPVQIIRGDFQRLLSSLGREENPDCNEICRRFLSDQTWFDAIPFDFVTFENKGSLERSFYNIMNIPKIKEFCKEVNKKNG